MTPLEQRTRAVVMQMTISTRLIKEPALFEETVKDLLDFLRAEIEACAVEAENLFAPLMTTNGLVGNSCEPCGREIATAIRARKG